MRIARLRWVAYSVPFRAPYVTALGSVTRREGLIVQMETERGRTGLGEAVLTPEVPDGGSLLKAAMAALAPRCAGLDLDDRPFEVEGDQGEAAAAVSAAIDVVASDALARDRGVSVASLSSETAATSVPVNALISAPALAAAAVSAAAAREAGFRTVKLKIGMAASIEAECARVAAVREAIGPELKLRLDPNGAWSPEYALGAIQRLADYDIEYVEQPLAPGNLDALARLQAAVDVSIAADEDVTDGESVRRILALGAARVLVLKPQRLGGLQPSYQVQELARRAGVACVVTTSIESGIGTAAALQLAAATSDGVAHGLATLPLLEDDLIKAPGLPVQNGRMRVPAGPGLGIELDEEALARFTVGEWEVSA